jgi:hypothetical protein
MKKNHRARETLSEMAKTLSPIFSVVDDLRFSREWPPYIYVTTDSVLQCADKAVRDSVARYIASAIKGDGDIEYYVMGTIPAFNS